MTTEVQINMLDLKKSHVSLENAKDGQWYIIRSREGVRDSCYVGMVGKVTYYKGVRIFTPICQNETNTIDFPELLLEEISSVTINVEV